MRAALVRPAVVPVIRKDDTVLGLFGHSVGLGASGVWMIMAWAFAVALKWRVFWFCVVAVDVAQQRCCCHAVVSCNCFLSRLLVML